MKKFDMKRARATLTNAVKGVDPFAVDYINWEAFEIELEASIEANAPKAAVLAVFSKAVNMARRARAAHAPIVKPS